MKTVLSVKTDKKIKEGAQKLARDLGVPLSLLVTAGLKDLVERQEVTFSTQPGLHPETIRQIREAIRDYKFGQNISPAFNNAKDAIAYLRKQTNKK